MQGHPAQPSLGPAPRSLQGRVAAEDEGVLTP